MARVEIYTKTGCPFCARAKATLDAKGAAYEETVAAGDPKLRAAMNARANGRDTFPQIFIDDRHIGGSDDLAALDSSGELDRLLAA